METQVIIISGTKKDLTTLSPSGIWYEGEINVAKKMGINLDNYALYKVVPGLRMRGGSGGKMVPLRNADAYELHLIKIK